MQKAKIYLSTLLLLLGIYTYANDNSITSLITNVTQITESLNDIQITDNVINTKTADFWYSNALLKNSLDEFKLGHMTQECSGEEISEREKFILGNSIYNTNPKLFLLVAIPQDAKDGINTSSEITNKKTGVKIKVDNLGNIFQGETTDGKQIYGITNEQFGKYQVEYGDGVATGKISKDYKQELIGDKFYGIGGVSAGATVKYSDLIAKLSSKDENNFETINPNDFLETKLDSKLGFGTSYHLPNGILVVEASSEFETYNSAREDTNIEHKYEIVRGLFTKKVNNDLAVATGITLYNKNRIVDIMSGEIELKGKKQTFILKLYPEISNEKETSKVATTYQYTIKKDYNMSFEASRDISSDNDNHKFIFTISKAF